MAENSSPGERIHLFAVGSGFRTLAAMLGAIVAGILPAYLGDIYDIEIIEAYRLAVQFAIAWWFLSLIPAFLLRRLDVEFEEHPERLDSLEKIIETIGATVVDFAGKTRCCGFPILTINEKNSVAMVAKHTSEVKDLGADAMITPCPLCHLNLDGYQPKASKQLNRSIDLPILHLPQLLGLAFGMDPKALGLSRHIVPTHRFLSAMAMSG